MEYDFDSETKSFIELEGSKTAKNKQIWTTAVIILALAFIIAIVLITCIGIQEEIPEREPPYDIGVERHPGP